MTRELSDYKRLTQARIRRIDRLRILYLFVSDYHGGQWSRGYRLLCLTRKRLLMQCKWFGATEQYVFSWTDNEGLLTRIRNTYEYKQLVAKYAGRI